MKIVIDLTWLVDFMAAYGWPAVLLVGFSTALLLLYWLWVMFLAVMSLQRAQKAGTLTPAAAVLGAPIALIAEIADITINQTLGTLFLGLPEELTLSERLTRLLGPADKPNTGWRAALARWVGKNLLDAFDWRGKHI